jgi:hypothetical protein
MRKLLVVALLAGCSSGVMKREGGTYFVSTTADVYRGQTAGANRLAYDEALKYCEKAGKAAVVVAQGERDAYGAGGGGGFSNGGGGGAWGSFAEGRANLRFRCE